MNTKSIALLLALAAVSVLAGCANSPSVVGEPPQPSTAAGPVAAAGANAAAGEGRGAMPAGDFAAPGLPTWLDGSSIVAADGTFLGRITKNPMIEDSLASPNSTYRSATAGVSIFNLRSVYGAPYGTYSPWNDKTPAAPKIVSNDRTRWAFLSVNPALAPRVDPREVLAFLGIR